MLLHEQQYIYKCIHIYIYIKREGEKEKKRNIIILKTLRGTDASLCLQGGLGHADVLKQTSEASET